MLASGDWAKRPAPRGLSPTQAAQVWPHRRQGAGAARCAASCACGRENEARGVTSECLHFLTGRECGLSQRSPWVTEITCDKRAPVAWQARARMLGIVQEDDPPPGSLRGAGRERAVPGVTIWPGWRAVPGVTLWAGGRGGGEGEGGCGSLTGRPKSDQSPGHRTVQRGGRRHVQDGQGHWHEGGCGRGKREHHGAHPEAQVLLTPRTRPPSPKTFVRHSPSVLHHRGSHHQPRQGTKLLLPLDPKALPPRPG